MDEYSTIHYFQKRKIGKFTFNFYNGAMSTLQCKRMIQALQYVKNKQICWLFKENISISKFY